MSDDGIQPELEFFLEVIEAVYKQLPPEISQLGLEVTSFRLSLTNESDRGSALMAAAYLEECLEKLLLANFIDDKTSTEVFKHNGPLGTFSSKIDTTFIMGLISRSVRADLNLLRKIRNEFAHTARPLTFNEPAIASRCRELVNPIGTSSAIPPRNRFNQCMMTIALEILSNIAAAKHARIKADRLEAAGTRESVRKLKELMVSRGLNTKPLDIAYDLERG